MITRRAIMAVLTAVLAARIPTLRAQQRRNGPRIGVLALTDIDYATDALREGLRDYSYIDGRNVDPIYKSARGDVKALPALARELVAGDLDVLVVMGAGPARAAKEATTKLPIVMAPVGNPVEAGLVGSLSRPGGNVTRVSLLSLDLAAKRIALAKDLLPAATRIALLMATSTSAPQRLSDEARAAARDTGVDLRVIEVAIPTGIEAALAAAKQWRADAVVVYPSPIFNSERRNLAALALRHRLPVIGEAREFADAGFLIGYGPSIADATRRAAGYVDRILKGRQPTELPIEQPTKLELVINLKTAKALGITVPQSLLLLADEVIQ